MFISSRPVQCNPRKEVFILRAHLLRVGVTLARSRACCCGSFDCGRCKVPDTFPVNETRENDEDARHLQDRLTLLTLVHLDNRPTHQHQETKISTTPQDANLRTATPDRAFTCKTLRSFNRFELSRNDERPSRRRRRRRRRRRQSPQLPASPLSQVTSKVRSPHLAAAALPLHVRLGSNQ